jgi:ABC-type transporter Mla maintaining outer membrane lipid asymmetry permease subunit MlaE
MLVTTGAFLTVGSMFSLSGSWNLTDFFVAVLLEVLAAMLMVVEVAPRVRADLAAGSGAASSA